MVKHVIRLDQLNVCASSIRISISDVQVRGVVFFRRETPLEAAGVDADITPEDEAALQAGTVDYIGFSYYNSNVATASGSRIDWRQWC